MGKKIELREISEFSRLAMNGVSVCADEFGEPIKATRSLIKKAKSIADTKDSVCVAFIQKGSKMYVLSEHCSYLSRFILFNATESEKESESLNVFVQDPLTSGRLYDKWIQYEKGKII